MTNEKEATRFFESGPTLAEIFAAREAYDNSAEPAKIGLSWRNCASGIRSLSTRFKVAALRRTSWKNPRAKLSSTWTNWLRIVRESPTTSYQDSLFYLELEDDRGERHEAYYAPISLTGIFYEKAL